MIKSLVFLFFLFVFNFPPHITHYVKYNATGSNDGTSWENAYTSFQSALDIAVSGEQIWVAAGTYYPSSAYDLTSTSRYYHFRMINGVAIYGGFAGTETLLSQRNMSATVTILSGDIGTPNDNTDNCYHVFYHPESNLNSSAILDGFTIKSGNANDNSGSGPHIYGGGMNNYVSSSPSLTNCTFSSNYALSGGGMYNYYSSPSLTNCIFESNSANYGGGCRIPILLQSSPIVLLHRIWLVRDGEVGWRILRLPQTSIIVFFGEICHQVLVMNLVLLVAEQPR